jgi:protein-S-isoprenylcysteine O-methyltransferase Ste14
VSPLFRWLGGALFAVSLLVCAWWYVAGLDHLTPSAARGAALAVDTALFSVFALHHSLFARPWARAAVARVLPSQLERSFYVWTASLLLLVTCLLWQPVGGELYHHTGWLAAAHAGVQIAGLVLVARAARVIDPLELAGVRLPDGPPTLQVVGPYRWIRHPIYLGWLLATFGAAHMTGDRFLFSTIAAIYLAAAVPFEERSLAAALGAPYADYRHRVRWRIVPGLY